MLRNLIIAVLVGALGMSIASKIADGVHIERPVIVEAQKQEQVVNTPVPQPTPIVIPTFPPQQQQEPLPQVEGVPTCAPFTDKGCYKDKRVGIE